MQNEANRRTVYCKGVAGKGKAGKGKTRQGRVRLAKAKQGGRGWQEDREKGKLDT